MLCRTCGKIIRQEDGDYQWHPGPKCWPDHEPMPETGETPYAMELREDMIEVALWASRNSRRSKQIELGCSEAGEPCLRKLGYRMANVPAVRPSQDPWPAIVGTSIHSWWEQAIADYQAAHNMRQWITELEVVPNPLVKGHTDLYDTDRKAVLDWKFPSTDNLKKMRADGPTSQQRVQVHLYGLGHVNAGRDVERVGLLACGRQGYLKDMYVWTEPFDREFAQAALNRVYDLGGRLIDLDVEADLSAWDQIEPSPSRLCGWCPWYNPSALGGATDKGCPGL